jgi:RNA ligase (TIGR02306 family)
MSRTPIECVRVLSIHEHPKADRLEIVKILGTQVCVAKGEYDAGDLAVYFPPDMMIPETVAEELGVKPFLKHSVYPGDTRKTQCRIGAIRLRQVPSVGFLLKCEDMDLHEGDDVTRKYGGQKYNPPMNNMLSGELARDTEYFPKYTSIQHYYRHVDCLPEGVPVRITEKIHGSNSRVGLIGGLYWPDRSFMCGTHRTNRREFDQAGRRSLYWQPMTEQMKEMLETLYVLHANYMAFDSVTVYGEIFGTKVQSMDYGVDGAMGYRVFDIAVGGEFLDWKDVKRFCDYSKIPTVPLLYEGPFRAELVDELMNGPTTVCGEGEIRCSFKGREGVVITPLEEKYDEELQGRLILKAVSPDYYIAMN